MRIGIYGGTFDPVHNGHLLLAEQCREQCQLDQVWFIPTGTPPHKTEQPVTAGTARAEMLDFATAGYPEFVVDRRELRREGRSFTFETLEELHSAHAEHEWFFLMGADSLHDLPTWREPARIAELATIVAVNRGDRPLPTRGKIEQTVGQEIADRIQLVTMPGIDLSATDIRRRVSNGQSVRFMVPRAVGAYIEQNHLYAADGPDA